MQHEIDVALVRWPAERARRDDLREQHLPRLLLIDAKSPPPEGADLFEDWIRLPADDRDVKARVSGLQQRMEQIGPTRPTIDADGVLRFGPKRVGVTGVENALVAALIERFEAVVSRDALLKAGWPDRDARDNSLHVHILRLRKRIEPLGLRIRSVRSRGYLLEPTPPPTG